MLLLLLMLAGPAEVEPFIPAGHEAIAVERGDLNRDGREDYILAIEQTDGDKDAPREVRILTRRADGSLILAKRGPAAILCKDCGGMMGDPFMGITVKSGRFTIEHYGGSASRWTESFTFAWSRRDRTWQLVRVETSSFHATDPENEEKSVYKPPKDFGKIDLEDFDCFKYRGVR